MQDIDDTPTDDDAEARFQRAKLWDQMLENEKVKKLEDEDDEAPTPRDNMEEDIYCAIT